MEQLILSALGAIITGFVTWFFARRKNNADAKSAEIDNEVKAAEFYKSLLDDASRRLEQAIETIEERDKAIRERDAKIEQLIKDIETLTSELRKFKQLNGKPKQE